MTAKIAKISAGPDANAKPKAVPSSGAVQGVASSVANTPAPKLPSKACLALAQRRHESRQRH